MHVCSCLTVFLRHCPPPHPVDPKFINRAPLFLLFSANIEPNPKQYVSEAAGQLGRALVVTLIQQGLHVRGFDVVPPADAVPGLDHVCGDLRRLSEHPTLLAGVSTVFHTASVIDIAPYPVETTMFDVNVSATDQLLQASRAAGVKRFIYTRYINRMPGTNF